ncbi:hypothetical protein SOVF_129820 [Spinacia oleracea]|nr:hypothetical protein SOVF_129820 [Spinacia oleracea]
MSFYLNKDIYRNFSSMIRVTTVYISEEYAIVIFILSKLSSQST